MSDTPSNFFGNTRGLILSLLRRQPQTVNDLAAALDLTDNAIRAQLVELMDEKLVELSGQRAGVRKPHALYILTPKAHELLSRLYVPVLTTLLDLLNEHLPPDQLEALVRGVGHRLAEAHSPQTLALPMGHRMDNVLHLLEGLGGDAAAKKESGHWVIRGKGCPLASVVSKHPDSCRLLETLLTDLLGKPVHEHCTKSPVPQCCFHVGA